jgi:fimbrial chaperone protein
MAGAVRAGHFSFATYFDSRGVGEMIAILRKALIAAAATALLCATAAYASMRVNPLIVYMSPTARGSSSVVQLTNVTDAPLPLDVTVMKRTVVDGAEVQVPAEDDFIIFPPQMIIQPGQTQAMRIQWVAGTVPTTSESYYVYVTQIPADLEPGMSGIRVAYRFGVSVHMVPPNTTPNLQVVSVRPATNPGGGAGFELTLRNDGNRYARMSEHEMSFGGRTWSRGDLKTAVGTGFMLPGQRRTFFVPFEGQVSASSTPTLVHRGAL